MENIKLGLTALTLSALLTACPATGSDRPTAPTALSLEGKVYEYKVTDPTPDTPEIKVVAQPWSAGAQPVYAKTGTPDGKMETIATGSISKEGALNITLPSEVSDTALISVDKADKLWLYQTKDNEDLTCNGSIAPKNEDTEAKIAAIQLFVPEDEDTSIVPEDEDTSMLLLESRLPSVNIEQKDDNAITISREANLVFFIYSTKDMTVQGTQKCHGKQSSEDHEMPVEFDSNVNIALKHGWNQIRYELVRVSSAENGIMSQKSKVHIVNDNSKQWYVPADDNLAIPLNLPNTAFSTLQ